MNCRTPGFPVLHYLLEFAQTHVRWVGDAIQPSHPPLSSSPFAFNLSQHQPLALEATVPLPLSSHPPVLWEQGLCFIYFCISSYKPGPGKWLFNQCLLSGATFLSLLSLSPTFPRAGPPSSWTSSETDEKWLSQETRTGKRSSLWRGTGLLKWFPDLMTHKYHLRRENADSQAQTSGPAGLCIFTEHLWSFLCRRVLRNTSLGILGSS